MINQILYLLDHQPAKNPANGYRKVARLFFESQHHPLNSAKKLHAFVLTIDFGKGAGYIGGASFYLARNSGSSTWQRRYRGQTTNRVFLGFEIGVTRNANRLPYLSH